MKRFCLAWLLVVGLIAAPGARSEDPAQSAALEMARQDMVLAQLTDLVARFNELRQDMDSNPGIGAEVAKITGGVRDRLNAIREVRLRPARQLLDAVAHQPRPNDPRLIEAQQTIAQAARELGSLLLQAGVSQAIEVFATEMREIVRQQQALPARGPAAPQSALADRTTTLVAELRGLRDSPADALAAIRLSRARKVVETGGVLDAMRQAAQALTGGAGDAAPRQAAALKGLREALMTLRPDRRLEELIRVRSQIQETAKAQQSLRDTLVGLPADQLAARKVTLALQQETILRPLAELDSALDLGATLPAARQAGVEATRALNAADSKAAAIAQELVSQCLAEMLYRLGEEIAKLSVLSATHQRMMEAAERVHALTEFRDRADQNRNSGYDLTLANKSLENVATAEGQLIAGIEKFVGRLSKENRFASSLRRPLTKAAKSLQQSVPLLKSNKFEAALPSLNEADTQFKDGLEIAKRELGMLERLWLYRQTAADIKQINRSLDDLVSEATDLQADLERAQREKRSVVDLAATQDLLARALAQLQENTGGIREAGAMRESQDAALTAMTKAKQQLEKDQAPAALDAIKQAHAALQLSRKTGDTIVTQIDMLLLELEVSTELSGKALDLWQRQVTLRETTEEAPETDFSRLIGEQDLLLGETSAMADITVAAAAAAFGQAAAEMKPAITQLQSKSRAPAVAHQKKAEEFLLLGLKELDAFLRKMLALLAAEGLGKTIITQYQPEYDAMTAILILATEQRELREVTLRTPDALLPNHAPKQTEFRRERMDEILKLRFGGPPRQHVQQAGGIMEQAIGTLNAKQKDASIKHQQLAEKELRIAYAMLLGKLLALLAPSSPGPPSDAVVEAKMADGFVLNSLGAWKEFSKSAPSGKPPAGTKGEWNSLVDRERSPLNENFARELPLEYRKLLKDYYEALSK